MSDQTRQEAGSNAGGITRVAAYALLRDDQSILLCRLSSRALQWQGFWTLPGGGLDFGESPEAALEREVLEETGLIINNVGIAAVTSLHRADESPPFHALRLIYNASVTTGALRYETDGTTDRCQWWHRDALAQLNLVDLAVYGIQHSFAPNSVPGFAT